MADEGRGSGASRRSRGDTAEHRYRSLAERVPGIAYSCTDLAGSAGEWLYVSSRIEELLGYTPEEWLADPELWERCVHPDDLEGALDDERRSLATGEPLVSEYRMITRDGRVRWFHDTAELVTPRDGGPTRYQGIMLDHTERKLAEQALRESERRKAAVLDASLDAIVTVDHRGRVLEWNAAAERIFGYPTEAALGQPVAGLIVPPVTLAAYGEDFEHRLAAAEGPVLQDRVEVTAMRAGGAEFPAELSVSRLASDPPTFTATIRDITDRVRNERERGQMEARLRQMERMETVGQLAGGVAHDFNNLLAVILNFTRFARDELDEGSPAKADLDEVILAAERAARLTQQLLTFSRKEPVQPEVLDLRAVVGDMEGLLRRTLGEHVELVIQTAEEPWPVRVDRGRLEQVVLNLAVNARDAMPEGGRLTIRVDNARIDPAYAALGADLPPGDYVRLSVTDTGEGIAPEVAERVFEPFFTTKAKHAGTGLGLATVYGIVHQAGGDIRLYSELGRGSVFRLHLPALPAERVTAMRPLPAQAPRGRGETVVLAEDEEAVRRVVRRVLEAGGYRVVATAGGQEALGALERLGDEVRLLLSDVVMPGMSGPELARRASESHPGLRVLFSSGYTDDLALLRDLRDERAAFIEKPFTAEQLLAKVRTVMSETHVA